MSTTVVIEGTNNNNNGSLREGFGILFDKILSPRRSKLIMGEGKHQAIKKFNSLDGSLLLCDLDGPVASVENDLKLHHLWKRKNDVFYMIQEMEAWFLSQPNILDHHFSANVSRNVPKKPAHAIPNPAEKLMVLVKKVKNRKYHKVYDGCKLLKLLDPHQLYNEFPDFKRLVDALRNP